MAQYINSFADIFTKSNLNSKLGVVEEIMHADEMDN